MKTQADFKPDLLDESLAKKTTDQLQVLLLDLAKKVRTPLTFEISKLWCMKREELIDAIKNEMSKNFSVSASLEDIGVGSDVTHLPTKKAGRVEAIAEIPLRSGAINVRYAVRFEDGTLRQHVAAEELRAVADDEGYDEEEGGIEELQEFPERVKQLMEDASDYFSKMGISPDGDDILGFIMDALEDEAGVGPGVIDENEVKRILSLASVKTAGIPSAKNLAIMFNKINEDSAGTEESVVPLTDVEYYTQQIENIFNVTAEEARMLAEQMAKDFGGRKASVKTADINAGIVSNRGQVIEKWVWNLTKPLVRNYELGMETAPGKYVAYIEYDPSNREYGAVLDPWNSDQTLWGDAFASYQEAFDALKAEVEGRKMNFEWATSHLENRQAFSSKTAAETRYCKNCGLPIEECRKARKQGGPCCDKCDHSTKAGDVMDVLRGKTAGKVTVQNIFFEDPKDAEAVLKSLQGPKMPEHKAPMPTPGAKGPALDTDIADSLKKKPLPLENKKAPGEALEEKQKSGEMPKELPAPTPKASSIRMQKKASTEYLLTGGRRVPWEKLLSILSKRGITENVNKDTTKDSKCLTDGTSYLWVSLEDDNAIGGASRYAGNNVESLLDAIEDVTGAKVLSEEDPEFYEEMGIDLEAEEKQERKELQQEGVFLANRVHELIDEGYEPDEAWQVAYGEDIWDPIGHAEAIRILKEEGVTISPKVASQKKASAAKFSEGSIILYDSSFHLVLGVGENYYNLLDLLAGSGYNDGDVAIDLVDADSTEFSVEGAKEFLAMHDAEPSRIDRGLEAAEIYKGKIWEKTAATLYKGYNVTYDPRGAAGRNWTASLEGEHEVVFAAPLHDAVTSWIDMTGVRHASKRTAATLRETLDTSTNRDLQNSQEYLTLSQMPLEPAAQEILRDAADAEGRAAKDAQDAIDALETQSSVKLSTGKDLFQHGQSEDVEDRYCEDCGYLLHAMTEKEWKRHPKKCAECRGLDRDDPMAKGDLVYKTADIHPEDVEENFEAPEAAPLAPNTTPPAAPAEADYNFNFGPIVYRRFGVSNNTPKERPFMGGSRSAVGQAMISDFNEEDLGQYFTREPFKIYDMLLHAVDGGRAFGTFTADHDLTPEEVQTVRDYIAGQCSDGWGEGFEQQPLPGDVYVSPWSHREHWTVSITPQKAVASRIGLIRIAGRSFEMLKKYLVEKYSRAPEVLGYDENEAAEFNKEVIPLIRGATSIDHLWDIYRKNLETDLNEDIDLFFKEARTQKLIRTAEDPLNPEPEKATPTTFKEYKKRPTEVPAENVETAPQASPEIVDAYNAYQQSQAHLERIKTLVQEATATMKAEVTRVEKDMKKADEIEKQQAALEKLARLVDSAETKTAVLGDKVLALYEETADVVQKATPIWERDKLLEKFGQDAVDYLERAKRSLESQVIGESKTRQIREFPNIKKSSLDLGFIGDLVNDLMGYIGLVDEVNGALGVVASSTLKLRKEALGLQWHPDQGDEVPLQRENLAEYSGTSSKLWTLVPDQIVKYVQFDGKSIPAQLVGYNTFPEVGRIALFKTSRGYLAIDAFTGGDSIV